MEVNSFRLDSLVWMSNIDPDNDVRTFNHMYATVGDCYFNYDTQSAFFCTVDGSETQEWQRLLFDSEIQSKINSSIALIPQANWTQSNSEASDYIKNKPPEVSQSPVTRTLNSIYQVSETRNCLANYSIDIDTVFTLTGGQSGTVYFEISPSSTFESEVQEVCRFTNANTGTLSIGIELNQTQTARVGGAIPAGYYARLRTENNISTPIFTYRSGQEVLL